MDKMIEELKKSYPNTNFIKSNRDGSAVLIYDNSELEWNDEFIEKVIQLAEMYLDKNELNTFTFLYDYLDEISTATMEKRFALNYINNDCYIKKEIKLGSGCISMELALKVKSNKFFDLIKDIKFDNKNKEEIFVIQSQSQF